MGIHTGILVQDRLPYPHLHYLLKVQDGNFRSRFLFLKNLFVYLIFVPGTESERKGEGGHLTPTPSPGNT